MKSAIREIALSLGASACGFAHARRVDETSVARYRSWIEDGCNATMDYCSKYSDVRYDPQLLLEGAQTVICLAFNYYTPDTGMPAERWLARYARGADYHYVVKNRLLRLGEFITEHYGGTVRALVDTAPMLERRWAQRSGIGFAGLNGQIIIPGVGSYCFLGELLWTGNIEPDAECTLSCDGCMACIEACPGNALDGSGRCDARRCTSYLTIEHRGDSIPAVPNIGNAYGCDVCLSVCPHNDGVQPTTITEFMPNPAIMSLTPGDIISMTPSHYKRLTEHSAMRRVPLRQLQRNLRYLYGDACGSDNTVGDSL